MTGALFALVERVHGHLGWLGVALLVHPVVTLWRRRGVGFGTQLTADLGAMLILVSFTVGWAIYPTYRTAVKPDLLQAHHALAMAFETKEHLAAMTAALATGGALTLRLAPTAARTTAHVLLALAALGGALTGILGVLVAAGAHPSF